MPVIDHEALFVGVGRYLHHPDLPSCVDAATCLRAELSRDYQDEPNWAPYPEDPSSVIGMVTENRLRKAAAELFASSGMPRTLLFSFAGHAEPVFADGDAGSGMPIDLRLLTTDDDPEAERHGVLISELFAMVPVECGLVVIVDCCYAGVAARMALPSPLRACVLAACGERSRANISGQVQSFGGTTVQLPEFTGALLAALDGMAADVKGRISLLSLFSNASDLMPMKQKPVLATNGLDNLVMQTVKPALTSRQLREMVSRTEADDHDRSIAGGMIQGRDRHTGKTIDIEVNMPIPWLFDDPNGYCDVYPWMESDHFWVDYWNGDGSDITSSAMRQMKFLKVLKENGLLKAYVREDWRKSPNSADVETDLFFAVTARYDPQSCRAGA